MDEETRAQGALVTCLGHSTNKWQTQDLRSGLTSKPGSFYGCKHCVTLHPTYFSLWKRLLPNVK